MLIENHISKMHDRTKWRQIVFIADIFTMLITGEEDKFVRSILAGISIFVYLHYNTYTIHVSLVFLAFTVEPSPVALVRVWGRAWCRPLGCALRDGLGRPS